MSGQGTVLVTGGSGFIGSWCVIRLLQQGYTVRPTVRSLDRESAVRAAIGKEVDPQDGLSFHAADLTSDAGWNAAASGCDYMLHSPRRWPSPNPGTPTTSSFPPATAPDAPSAPRSRPA